MITRFILFEDAIKHVLALTDNDIPILTSEEWNIYIQLHIILEPLAEVTRVMRSESYLSATKIIPITRGLKSMMNKLSSQINHDTLKSMKHLLEGVEKRFPNLEKR